MNPQAEVPAYRPPVRPSTWVYFVQDTISGAVKIGKADDPKKRLSSLQVGTASPLNLIGYIPADRDTENEMHARFAHLHLRGEWFRPASELIAFIRWNGQRDRPVADLNARRATGGANR